GPHAARRGARPRDRRGDRLVLPGRHSPLRHSPLRGGRRPTVKAMADNADHDRPTLPDAAVTEITELFEDAVAQHKTSGVTWAIVGGHTASAPCWPTVPPDTTSSTAESRPLARPLWPAIPSPASPRCPSPSPPLRSSPCGTRGRCGWTIRWPLMSRSRRTPSPAATTPPP